MNEDNYESPIDGLMQTQLLADRLTPEQRETALKQQQQQLLRLRHASRCPSPPQHCQYASWCGLSKNLWVHITTCKNQQCQIPHCVTSRYALCHYHKCTQDDCAFCWPIRKALIHTQNNQVLRMVTPQEQEQRRQSIHHHMQLLLHSSQCQNEECPSANCNLMKISLIHIDICAVQSEGGCIRCKRFHALLKLHSQMCQRENCTVPRCKQRAKKRKRGAK